MVLKLSSACLSLPWARYVRPSSRSRRACSSAEFCAGAAGATSSAARTRAFLTTLFLPARPVGDAALRDVRRLLVLRAVRPAERDFVRARRDRLAEDRRVVDVGAVDVDLAVV